MTQAGRRSLKERIVSEAIELFYVVLYVWLLLAIFGLHKSLILAEEHIVARQGLIIVKALAFAKIIFVAEELKLGERFEDRPLIWPVLFKSALFALLLVGFDLAEQAIVDHFWPKAGADDALSLRRPESVALGAALAFTALVPFFALRELSDVLGAGHLREVMFQRRRRFVPAPDETQRERHLDVDETAPQREN
jgi:hypothetical protein